jgi:hypothetical protein
MKNVSYSAQLSLLCILLGLAATLAIDPNCTAYVNVRAINGYCNNLNYPTYCNSFIPERRFGSPNYQDGKSVPVNGPNARVISQSFFALPPQKEDVNKTADERTFGAKPDIRSINMFAVTALQFLTHDLSFVPLNFIPGDPNDFGIPILNCTAATSRVYDELCIWPTPGDPNANPPQTTLFTRPSQAVFDSNGVFTPITNVTGWVDLSTVYGSDSITGNAVRSFVNGLLKTGSDGEALPRAADIGVGNDCGPFVVDGSGAGDTRVDENLGITTLHVTFLRNHNWLAGQIKAQGVLTTDEAIFQKARDINIATWQHIVYDELLPQVLGPYFTYKYLPRYTGYNANVNPNPQIEVFTAGFRFHNMINLPLLMINTSCQLERGNLAFHAAIPSQLAEQFNCQPDRFRQVGSEGVLRGITMQYSQYFNEPVTDALRNLRLDGAPGNVDVAAADIFRSRLHGMPDYDTIRVLYGRPSIYSQCSAGTTIDPLHCFLQITGNVSLANSLRNIYQKVNKIDPIVGLHAEDIPIDASVSETAAAMQMAQLLALRDGDRFWYQNYLPHVDEQTYVTGIRMTDLLLRAFPDLSGWLAADSFVVNYRNPCFLRGHS